MSLNSNIFTYRKSYRYDANGERICKYSDLGETIYASGYYTETDGKKISCLASNNLNILKIN